MTKRAIAEDRHALESFTKETLVLQNETILLIKHLNNTNALDVKNSMELANNQSVNASICLVGFEDTLFSTPNISINNVILFISTILNDTNNFVNVSISAINATLEIVNEVQNYLVSCSRDDQDCIKAVADDIESMKTSLPLFISGEVNEVLNTVKNGNYSTHIVVHGIKLNFLDTTLSALSGILECVHNLLSNKI